MTEPSDPLELDDIDFESLHKVLLEARKSAMRDYRALVADIRRSGETDPDARTLYHAAVANLAAGELTRADVTTIARLHKSPLRSADSFWASIVARRRKKQLGWVPERRLGVSKDHDRRFAELLGVRVPNQLYTGPFSGIPPELRQNVVVKPIRSADSRGVFYVFAENNIVAVRTSEELSSWDHMTHEISAQLGADPEQHTWEVQELVTEEDAPARDLKILSFYGEVGLIVEAIRYPTTQFAFFNPDGTEAPCGYTHAPRFIDPALTIVDKGGLTEEKLALVRRMSEELPVPFMRIDFLNTESELVFCEMSSAPGNADRYNRKYDRLLGRLYHRAENRLVEDLLAGKRFEAFHTFSQAPVQAAQLPGDPTP